MSGVTKSSLDGSRPPTHRPASAPLPPKHKSRPKAFDFFAADCFDKRLCNEQREWTPLGEMVQCFWELRRCMKRECPDVLEFLEQHDDH